MSSASPAPDRLMNIDLDSLVLVLWGESLDTNRIVVSDRLVLRLRFVDIDVVERIAFQHS